jgi:hypothetical protein
MAFLTERQRTAEALAREIQKLGGWVTSPMPLDHGAKLRYHVLDKDREKVLEILSSWNWSPAFVSVLPRVTPGGMLSASIYEIYIEPERQPIVDDRTIIHGELATRQKPSAEYTAMLEACWGKK